MYVLGQGVNGYRGSQMKPSKRVAITGASSGIGAATARIFSKHNYELLLIARRTERLESLIEELQGHAQLHTQLKVLDIRNRQDVEEALRDEKIDILINNAGLAFGLDPFYECPVDDIEQMVETNIQGLLYCTHAVLPGMIERNSGHIINIGSLAGSYPYAGGHVYGATKAFVEHFSRNLSTDLLGKQIRVTNIAPGLTETEFSLNRFKLDKVRADAVYSHTEPLTAEDIADAILYCAGVPPRVNIKHMEIMPVFQTYGGFKIHKKESS